MQFSERWLRTLVDPPLSTAELAHLLTMSGLEVESCDPVAPPTSKVVVGHVRKVSPHPQADRLKVCEVDAGTGTTLQIVCAAPNVTAGMKAPLALVGATVPAGEGGAALEIRAAKMRGVESHGMLCSARELGLSDDHTGLLALPADAPVGADVRQVLELDDHILLVKLTPNRADCLSVLGVAREVAALTGAALKPPGIAPVPAVSKATFPVRISDPDGCGRFTGRVIRSVNAAAPTPAWMVQRLERAGQRSISALVDVTNYVMLELGRPLHVYDLDKLSGGIDVRFGRSGEHVRLLNEQTVALEPDVLAITDASGPIGLAGIMGGDSTKAETTTRNVFLEAAFFFPDAIAGRARRYNFTSDASHRFERGVDYDNNVTGIERATRLILEICGGEPGPVVDEVARLPRRPAVRMRVARAQKIIGVPIAANEMTGIFTRLGLQWRSEGHGEAQAIDVTPPSYRFDLQIEADLIEEVARVHGFERIPVRPPLAPAVMRTAPENHRDAHQLRDVLAAAGYQEVINFGFVEADWERDFAGNGDPIRLLNPIASQLAVMRTSLIGGLVDKVRYNLNRRQPRVRVFEVGRVFLRQPGAPEGVLEVAGIRQPMRVAAVAYGTADAEQWGVRSRPVDFFDVKGDLQVLAAPLTLAFEPARHPALHPGRSARVLLNGTPIGWLGELQPQWQQKYELPQPLVLFEVDALPLQTVPVPAYQPVSRFPSVTRDLSFVVDAALPVQGLLDDLGALRAPGVTRVFLFDVYQGEGVPEGKKSLAFRVLLQDTEKTLTDADVDLAVQQLRDRLAMRFGAQLRGNEGQA
jgi:phenylalanyl-tRNA synthetase beta chain